MPLLQEQRIVRHAAQIVLACDFDFLRYVRCLCEAICRRGYRHCEKKWYEDPLRPIHRRLPAISKMYYPVDKPCRGEPFQRCQSSFPPGRKLAPASKDGG